MTDKGLLDQGSVEEVSYHLISEMVLPIFNNPILSQLDDGALSQLGEKRLAFSNGSYVIDPIFSLGGI